jgi:hypothetical protein
VLDRDRKPRRERVHPHRHARLVPLIGSVGVLDARYALSTNDGEFVLVRNCGPFGALVPLFETRADGAYAFRNANTYMSSDPRGATGGVSITFYERGQ